MIELDRLRYDLIHGTPADEAARAGTQPGAAGPQSVAAAPPPWLATMAGAMLVGYGLTRSHGLRRIGFLSAGAGLLFFGWKQREPLAKSPVKWGDEHPVDVASQGSFPASDPPSLSPLA